jgi:hypothetical protein
MLQVGKTEEEEGVWNVPKNHTLTYDTSKIPESRGMHDHIPRISLVITCKLLTEKQYA